MKYKIIGLGKTIKYALKRARTKEPNYYF